VENLDFSGKSLYNHRRLKAMIRSLQIEKTMTKTVVVKRKAKRAGNGVNRCEYLRNEHHFPVAVQNVFTE